MRYGYEGLAGLLVLLAVLTTAAVYCFARAIVGGPLFGGPL